MKKSFYIGILSIIGILFFSSLGFIACNSEPKTQAEENEFVGSESCIECHEKFYKLWSPSHHGKAMQMIDSNYIANEVTPYVGEPERVGNNTYEVVFENDSIIFLERNDSSDKVRRLPALWALGGRNVTFMLTPWEGGRLQTLPLSYDVNTKSWYNNPESGVRHFTDPGIEDEALDWRHSSFTFNTTCHGCHVSQLEKNYDEENKTYHTIWKEPGINCETCHGPSQKHNEVMRKAAKEGKVLELHEMELVITSTFTPEQHIASCSPCHAKMSPITTSYPPGEPFYDHFNAVTFENPDFYADGRDLGENYTWSTWRQNKCVEESDLHCITCHTSSGRDRNADDPNQSCIKCHDKQGNDFKKHTHHKPGGDVTCVSCHMPNTMFARMTRSDHSFRPPNPAASIEFGSPNACNICHDDKTPQWANKHVTKWKGTEYQQEDLYYGGLVKAARDEHNYARIDEMLDVIDKNETHEMYIASMIRLLEGSEHVKKAPLMQKTALTNESPLVRSAAVDALRNSISMESKDVLLKAAQDSMRVVRVSAGASLANYPDNMFTEAETTVRNKVLEAYKESQKARPDHWSAHYNLGNFYMGRQDLDKALESFEMASELEPEVVSPYVNASLVYSQKQNTFKAEELLKKALVVEPNNAATNVNYGLLLGELGRLEEAKSVYRKALKIDPNIVTAAYNLAVITSRDSMKQALKYSKLAYEIRPEDPKYLYTYVFFLNSSGNPTQSATMAKKLVKDHPNYFDGYAFLENLYRTAGNNKAAINMYQNALKSDAISVQVKQGIQQRLQMLSINQ